MSAQPGLVHDGNYRVVFVPEGDGSTGGIADQSAPTVEELNTSSGAIELQCQITPDGLSREASDEAVDTSRLCSVFTTQRVGRTSFEVSLTLVRLDPNAGGGTEDVAFKSLRKNVTGYLVIRDNKSADEPFTDGDEVEVYYVECGTRSKATPAANEQMTFTVPFMVLTDPSLDAAVGEVPSP